MLKSQHNHIMLSMEQIEQQHVDQLKNHARNFEYEVTKLCDVVKERYEFFVEQAQKLEEYINLKVAELSRK